MRPADLQPGDVLLFRNFGVLGSVLSWFEWNGRSGEALEYSHIALVLNDTEACEMNPPASRKYPLAEVPWDRVDVYRVSVDSMGTLYQPFRLNTVRNAFQAEALRRLGERYNFGYIAELAGVGILARIGLGKISSWLMNRANPAPDNHRDICSTWAEEVVEVAVGVIQPGFDLLPDLGVNEARPSDWPRSPWVKRVDGPLTGK